MSKVKYLQNTFVMKKNKLLDKYTGKWVLFKKNKVIYYSSNIVDVVQEGHKYPITDVSIEKKLLKGRTN